MDGNRQYGVVDVQAIARDIATLSGEDPEKGRALQDAVSERLSPADRRGLDAAVHAAREEGRSWFSGVTEAIGDFDRNNGKVLTRAGGLLQAFGGGVSMVGGGAMVVGGGGACGPTAGAGCVVAAGGVVVAAVGADNAQAGLRTAWTGESQNTLTYEGLRAAGMSESSARLVDLALGVGAAGVGVAGRAITTRAVGAATPSGEVLVGANFAQTSINRAETFSAEGARIYSQLAGRPISTVDDLAGAIRSGQISPRDIPVEYIVRDGNTLILNTRTSVALERAGVPRTQWNALDRTGQEFFENLLTGQLQRNNLTSAGTPSVRTHGQP